MQNKLKLKVLDAILPKFGTQKKCAEALGITESTLSKNLNKLNPKFISRLKDAGVKVDFYYDLSEPLVKEKPTYYIDSEKANLSLRNKYLEDQVVKLKAELYDLAQSNTKFDINHEDYKNTNNIIFQELLNSGKITKVSFAGTSLIPLIADADVFPLLKSLLAEKGTINQGDMEKITEERIIINGNIKNAFAGTIFTDRNEPYIHKGDIVVSTFDDKIKSNDIVALILKDTRWFVGKYIEGIDSIIIEFFNKKYNPVVIKEEEIIMAVKIIQLIRKFE